MSCLKHVPLGTVYRRTGMSLRRQGRHSSFFLSVCSAPWTVNYKMYGSSSVWDSRYCSHTFAKLSSKLQRVSCAQLCVLWYIYHVPIVQLTIALKLYVKIPTCTYYYPCTKTWVVNELIILRNKCFRLMLT